MDFTEETKKIIRKRALFKCCFCQNLDIEIHHIKPEKEGGSNDISNGAPLCPNCHERFGNDPSKRNRIIEARDAWYDIVENMYPKNGQPDRTEEISIKLEQLQNNLITLNDFKQGLREVTNEVINNMTTGTAVSTASGIANVASSSTTAVKLGNRVHANMVCRKCETQIGLLIGSNNCPTCGEPVIN